jgi:hypothetical protein
MQQVHLVLWYLPRCRDARADRAEHHARSRRRGDRISEPMSAHGPELTSRDVRDLVANERKVDVTRTSPEYRD